ncbi:hypothetical protein E2C01_009745 [Portunus trituberculatus]|uniref:Uncharacterized protein n=1 Tax=Portunus trituberculatus TaxID=210409 RepID=A0A5B7D6J6_PORTR|nr:hypothetical protein [Portunus trituberculatus]
MKGAAPLMGGREGTREPGAVPGTEEHAELLGMVEVEGEQEVGWWGEVVPCGDQRVAEMGGRWWGTPSDLAERVRGFGEVGRAMVGIEVEEGSEEGLEPRDGGKSEG